MRRMPEGLRLVGPEVLLLLDRISPYDSTRLPAREFLPAEEYVASLGHLLRAHRDPKAWIREAAFELDLRELFLAGDEETLDTVEELLADRRPESPIPEYLTFKYLDLDLESNFPTYDPDGLRFMSAEELEDMIAADAAGGRIMAHHGALLDTAFATFFTGWTGWPLRIVSTYAFKPLGLGYDHGLSNEGARRSHVETHGRLRPANQGAQGGPRLDDRELFDWLSAHLDHGAIAVRDVDLAGHHEWVLIAADGRSALPIDRDPAGWRLGVPRPIGAGDRERLMHDQERIARRTSELGHAL